MGSLVGGKGEGLAEFDLAVFEGKLEREVGGGLEVGDGDVALVVERFDFDDFGN